MVLFSVRGQRIAVSLKRFVTDWGAQAPPT